MKREQSSRPTRAQVGLSHNFAALSHKMAGDGRPAHPAQHGGTLSHQRDAARREKKKKKKSYAKSKIKHTEGFEAALVTTAFK